MPGRGLEIVQRPVRVFRPRARSSLHDVSRALDLHSAFLEKLPRVVFPGRPDLGAQG